MEKYDGLNYGYGTHTIKVSLQNEQYKGAFTHTIGGNCKGLGVLDFDISVKDAEEVAKLNMLPGCTIKRDEEDEDYLLVVLTNPNDPEDTCESELEDDEFNGLIVGIEIVDFKVDKK